LSFSQLFDCEFMADGDAVFEFSQLHRSGVDSWDLWGDFYKPFTPRPCGNAAGVGGLRSIRTRAMRRGWWWRWRRVLPGDKFRMVSSTVFCSGNDFAAASGGDSDFAAGDV
jgi:hypothetical protein